MDKHDGVVYVHRMGWGVRAVLVRCTANLRRLQRGRQGLAWPRDIAIIAAPRGGRGVRTDTGRAARGRRPWGAWVVLRDAPGLGRGLGEAGLLGTACRRRHRRGVPGSGQELTSNSWRACTFRPWEGCRLGESSAAASSCGAGLLGLGWRAGGAWTASTTSRWCCHGMAMACPRPIASNHTQTRGLLRVEPADVAKLIRVES